MRGAAMKLHRHTETFDAPATRRYSALARGPLRWVYRSLARAPRPALAPGPTVLDVGTGPGSLLAELARQHPDIELIGVDISADMAAAARTNLAPYGPRVTVHTGDVARLPLADG